MRAAVVGVVWWWSAVAAAAMPPMDPVEQARERAGTPALWHREGALTPAGRALLAQLAAADERGLNPADYDVQTLQALATAHDAASQATLDRRLSQAAVLLATHLQRGRVTPAAAGYQLPLPAPAEDPVATLLALSGSTDLPAALDGFEPHYNHYHLLKQALAQYRQLAALPPLPALPALPMRSVKPGETYAGADALRARLARLGDLPAAQASSSGTVLDEVLAAALARFQGRHGLQPDGVLGAGTLAALQVPLTDRVRQLHLSMERARWLPRPSGPFILVNIPQFRLYAFRGPGDSEQHMLAMNVIVGRTFPSHNTPVFMADMRYVVFRPYWDVPPSIARNEILPKLRERLAWGGEQDYELVRGQSDSSQVVAWEPAALDALQRGELRVRQKPGARNALGRVKFMFPNPYNVYLHSTPAQSLFARSERAFSHGCVRVEDPQALGEFVFAAESGWNAARVADRLQAQGGPERVNLSRSLRVIIFYATAIAAEDGRILFLPDLYRHDQRLTRLLAGRL